MYEGGINVAQRRHSISAGGESECNVFLVVHANYQVVEVPIHGVCLKIKMNEY
jgi:hypothetical protein